MDFTLVFILGFLAFAVFMLIYKLKEKKQQTITDYIQQEEQKLEDNDYAITLHILMCKIEDLAASNYLPEIDKLSNEIKENLKSIVVKYNANKHPKLVVKALQEYKFSHDSDTPTTLQLSIIEQPKKFDILAFKKQRYTEVVNNYAPYWTGVLNSLKRQHAIINRRKYLVENVDMMIGLCKQNRYNELIPILENYKAEQQKALEQ